VAYTPRWLNRETGEWSESPTSFLTVICWRKLADNVRICLRKGEPVLVRGRLQVRRYEDKDGAPRIAVELDASSVGHDLARGVALFQRLQRDPAEASARPAVEARTGSAAAGAANGEAGLSADEAVAAAAGADEAAAVAAGSAEVPAAQPAGTSRKRRGATGAGRSSGHAAESGPSGTADSSALDDDVVAALTGDGNNQPEAEKAPVPV
jgi:single-strand DNA-binding protein